MSVVERFPASYDAQRNGEDRPETVIEHHQRIGISLMTEEIQPQFV